MNTFNPSRIRTAAVGLAVLAGLGLGLANVQGQSTWIISDGWWTNAAAWSPAGVPNNVPALLTNTQPSYTVTHDFTTDPVSSLTLSNLNASQVVNLIVTGSTLVVTNTTAALRGATLDIQSGATLNSSNVLVGSSAASGGGNRLTIGGTLLLRAPATTTLNGLDVRGTTNTITVLSTGLLTNSANIILRGGNISAGTVSTLTNAGTIYTGRLIVGEEAGNGALVMTNGLMAVSSAVSIGASGSSGAIGTFTLTDGTVVNDGTLSIGTGPSIRVGTLTVNGGIWSNRATSAAAIGSVSSGAGAAAVTATGTVTVANSGVFVGAGDFQIGQIMGTSVRATNATVVGTVNVLSGGQFITSGTNFNLGNLSSAGVGATGATTVATLNVNGGTFIATNAAGNGTLRLGHRIPDTATFSDNTASGIVNLDSGTITVNRLIATNAGLSQVNFNGGSLNVNSTVYSNGTGFVVGNGVSAANLNLQGGTHSFADGFTLNTNATLSGDGFSVLNSGGNLALITNSTLEVDLSTNAPSSYDQIVVLGTVGLADSILDLRLTNFTAVTGDQFTIIDNDGTDAVTGTFTGLPQGIEFDMSLGGTRGFKINYLGGTGNDVVLTVIPEPGTMALLAGAAVLLIRRRS